MERLRQLQEQQGDMADVDVEMFGRLESVDGDAIVGVIDRVELSEDGRNRKWLVVEVDTFVGMEQDKFLIPDIPQSDSEIVRLCKDSGVDPKFPSQLVGCEVRWDGNGIVIPKFASRKDAIKNDVQRFLDSKIVKKLKTVLFYMFTPISVPVYFSATEWNERPFTMREWSDYGFSMLFWTVIVVFGFIGILEFV